MKDILLTLLVFLGIGVLTVLGSGLTIIMVMMLEYLIKGSL